MKEWQLAETPDSGPAIMEGQEVVMYVDDLNPEVMAKIAELHNAGKTTEELDAYLLDEEKCDQEQREFIMEQIVAYLKLTTVSETATVQKPQVQPQGSGDGSIAPTPQPQQQPNQPQPPLTPQQRAAITRRQNATAAPKKAGTAEAIKALEEKISLIKLLDGAEVLDIPTGLGKDARELMTAFQKEQQSLIDTYLEKVQKL